MRIFFDQRLHHLRATAVAMAAVLATYGSALLLEHLAHLRVDIVIQAVVLAATSARVQRAADRVDRLLGLAVLPAAAMAAAELSRLMASHPDPADALFVAGVGGSIWVRRFGPRATRAGTLAVLPLISILVVRAPAGHLPGHDRTLWVGLVALIAGGWGAALAAAAVRAGILERPRARPATPAPAPVPAPTPKPTPAAAPGARSGGGRHRPAAGTRMALQMAVALAAAFAVGRNVWPDHWSWVVLTAFIVCSGARGRGDVLLKGAQRTGGAALGTVVATAVAGSFGPHANASVVLIFTVLAVATWLREWSYAYWAGCVTAVLSLLYGWFGESADDLLRTRLAGIGAGAALGIAASWLILPVRTRDVLRRRTAEALAALGDLLATDRQDQRALRRGLARFEYRLEQLLLIAGPLRVQRRVAARLGPGRPQPADAVDAVRRCAEPARTLVRCWARPAAPAGRGVVEDPGVAADPDVAAAVGAVRANLAAVRRAIGGQPGAPYRAAALAPAGAPGAGPRPESAAPASAGWAAWAALTAIDGELALLAEMFGGPAGPDAPGPGRPAPATAPAP
ncbi:FUSC family protein [Kitasatospora sp. NPDC088346]|uniref:FUSC family protein n=1 Tax=Kitasatospora sp. NPDC088346 TaxID=3364073 RepID=UPI0037F1D536